MDIRRLECFLAVADHLHFGRAAEALSLAQSTVSQAVRGLEHELGAPLFERHTRRVELTLVGRTFLPEARAAYEALRAAYERAQALAREQTGDLVVGCPPELGQMLVSRVVPALRRHSPTALLTFRHLPTLRQMEMLRMRRLHAGLCWTPELDGGFASVVVECGRLVAVLPTGHPLAGESTVALAAVADEPLIGWPREINPILYDRFADALRGTGRQLTPAGTVVGGDNVAARVLAGFGVGFVFEHQARRQPVPGVRYIPLDEPVPGLERHLVWRTDERHPALAGFVRVVTELFDEPGGPFGGA